MEPRDDSHPAKDLYAEARALADPEFVSGLVTFRFGPAARGIALLWAQLALAWATALAAPPPFALLSLLVVCACHQGMLLWVHEASHGTLARTRDRSDFWIDLLVATPIGMTVRAYRASHLSHHAYLGTSRDRDRWAFALDLSGSRLFRVLLLGMMGYYGVLMTVRKYLGSSTREGEAAEPAPDDRTYRATRWLMVAFWNALFLGLAIAAGRFWVYPLLWIAPLVTVAVLLNVVRSTAEHQPAGFESISDLDAETVTRTTVPGWFEKWLLYQVNFNYHFEHHTWPRVPFFHLPRLHQHLSERGFYERHPECLQPSGFGTLLALHRGITPARVA
jgi:fatty acid desaturase